MNPMSRPSWYVPAFPHDHKIVLRKGPVVFGFLWKTDSDDMLVQRDTVENGKNRRTAKQTTKGAARKLWNRCVGSGFVKIS